MSKDSNKSKNCKIKKCNKPSRSQGLCSTHYYRLYKYGDPEYSSKRVKNHGNLCIATDCDLPSYVKGYCQKHYGRLRTYGDANAVLKSPKGVFSGCKVDGCLKKHSSKGYCTMHYSSFVNYGDPLITKQGRKGLYKNCTVEDCNREHEGRGYCSMHLTRIRKFGTPTPDMKFPTPRGQNLSNGETKTCSRCGLKKANVEFHISRSRPDGLNIYCKDCSTEFSKVRYADPQKRSIMLIRGRMWREKNPEADVRKHLRRKYGMTLEQYNTLFDKQKGLCALCSKPESVKRNSKSERPERLAVDHCHDTGRIRGLLCFKCNTAVGSIGDDEESAKRVVEYFESNALKVLHKSKKA